MAENEAVLDSGCLDVLELSGPGLDIEYLEGMERTMSEVLIGGPERRGIVIKEYDPQWSEHYLKHEGVIKEALGKNILSIAHVGSTSVPGLAAKAIIDIDVVVENSADETLYLPALEKVGYVLRVREPDWHEHRMFRTPELDVHIHVFSPGVAELKRHAIFRDYLSENAEDRQVYEEVKREMAKKDWHDMSAYAHVKSEVIEGILRKAFRARGEEYV